MACSQDAAHLYVLWQMEGRYQDRESVSKESYLAGAKKILRAILLYAVPQPGVQFNSKLMPPAVLPHAGRSDHRCESPDAAVFHILRRRQEQSLLRFPRLTTQ